MLSITQKPNIGLLGYWVIGLLGYGVIGLWGGDGVVGLAVGYRGQWGVRFEGVMVIMYNE